MIERERLIIDGWEYHCSGHSEIWSRDIVKDNKVFYIYLYLFKDGQWHVFVEDERFACTGIRVVDSMDQLGKIINFFNNR